MTAFDGKAFGLILCKSLNIPAENVLRIELVADARDAAMVKITRFVSDSEAGILGALMREFSLVEAEEVEELDDAID